MHAQIPSCIFKRKIELLINSAVQCSSIGEGNTSPTYSSFYLANLCVMYLRPEIAHARSVKKCQCKVPTRLIHGTERSSSNFSFDLRCSRLAQAINMMAHDKKQNVQHTCMATGQSYIIL